MRRIVLKCIVQVLLLITMMRRGYSELTGQEAVVRFFQYFKADDPVGIPVLNFDEPMELYSPLETIPITLYDGKLYGHSKIKIEEVFVDFISLTGEAKITAPKLEVRGNYSWPGFYYTSEGFMYVQLIDVVGSMNFTMFIDEQDELEIRDAQISQESSAVEFNLTDLIWEHRAIMKSGAIHILFDDLVLEMFRQLQPFLMSEANREISKFISTLPEVSSFLSPEDLKSIDVDGPKESKSFVILFKRLVDFMGFEPLFLPDQSSSVIGVKFKVTDMVLHSISTVETIHTLLVHYHNKEIFIEASMTHPVLFLYYNVNVERKMLMNFDMFQKVQLNDVTFRLRLLFDPSVKKPPKINYFDIDVGSFGKVRSGRRKSIWGKMLHFFSNIDDAIMKEVLNALQGPIRKILQKELNNLDVEKAIIQILDKN